MAKLTERQKKHKEYLRSAIWRDKKAWFASLTDFPICSGCGAWDVPLHVHHLTYVRVGGDELAEDLTYVCEPCHFGIHKQAILAQKKRNTKPKKLDENGLTRRQRKRKIEKRLKQNKKHEELKRIQRVKDYMENKK